MVGVEEVAVLRRRTGDLPRAQAEGFCHVPGKKVRKKLILTAKRSTRPLWPNKSVKQHCII